MYLKRVEGPRAVRLRGGGWLTLADLPAPDTRRWVASRKAVVVAAVAHGLVSRRTALERWDLSEEELALWEAALAAHGPAALKTTKLGRYRQP